ncbi:histidine phosphatase family protein [Aerococcaceae bacterium zg-BR9]|uniref:histidine phosphatase family protein n=1 Tax=Aerococcaceae bacterium zg-1292 TaxID=2774330 RepID=UPI004062ABBB|nr:histidine phosphatase family protein [Aerococcaceae bacterium zg-BR9]
MSKGVTFYFMRHAETMLNRMERVQGWVNAPLTDKGIRDTQRSGRGLADIRFDAVYTSDLMRTIETANIILEENHHADHLTPKPMKEFREVNFGYYEGLDANELWRDVHKYMREVYHLESVDNQVQLFLNTVHELDPYKMAEDYKTFWMRVESGLLYLLNEHADTQQNILIVSHGLTIQNLLHGLIADFNETQRLSNASVTKVQYIDGQFKLLSYNGTSHFVKE